MSEKMDKVIDKLEGVAEKTVDYVTEHPVKTLLVSFVVLKIIKWLRD